MRRITSVITPLNGVSILRPSFVTTPSRSSLLASVSSTTATTFLQQSPSTIVIASTTRRWMGDDSKGEATKKKSEPAKRQDKGIIAPPPLPSVMLKPKLARMPRGSITLLHHYAIILSCSIQLP
jgi:hypothetical protein